MNDTKQEADTVSNSSADDLLGWVKRENRLPDHCQKVIAIYEGVYDHRIVLFWRDAGGGYHFGYPDSQPVTHWHPLPSLP